VTRQRSRRRLRIRNRIKRDSTRLRLSVFRSHKHIYAQVIDDEQGRTVAAASTMDKTVRNGLSYGGNRAAAELVGKAIAERALEAGIKQVALDRGDYKYHGRVAALADAARDAGLDLGPKKEVVEPEKPEAKKKPKKKSPSKKS
jgi:large subunit ribosomal protein L18